MAWQDLTGAEISHRSSEVESRRFGRSIGRLTIGADVADSAAGRDRLVALLDTLEEDVVVVRYPGSALGWGAVLARSGRTLLPAGSLTYWEVDAAGLAAGGSPGSGGGRRVTDAGRIPGADRETVRALVAAVVRDSFAGYGNHYAANPLLSGEAALEGYVEWATRALEGAGQDVLLLWDGPEPVGVATLETSADGQDLEILLAGLVSAAQGHGWYRDLLVAVGNEAVGRGCARVVISTQTHNTRVQRAWVRAGFRPYSTVETVHAVRAGLV